LFQPKDEDFKPHKFNYDSNNSTALIQSCGSRSLSWPIKISADEVTEQALQRNNRCLKWLHSGKNTREAIGFAYQTGLTDLQTIMAADAVEYLSFFAK